MVVWTVCPGPGGYCGGVRGGVEWEGWGGGGVGCTILCVCSSPMGDMLLGDSITGVQ